MLKIICVFIGNKHKDGLEVTRNDYLVAACLGKFVARLDDLLNKQKKKKKYSNLIQLGKADERVILQLLILYYFNGYT